MGDIGQGIGQMPFLFFQGVILLPDAQGHFGDFGLQDGQLALVHLADIQAVPVVEHLINLFRNLRNASVPGSGEQKKSRPIGCSGGEKQKPCPGLESESRPGADNGHPGEPDGEPAYLSISKHNPLPDGILSP